eukprot:8806617-Lingulodinium_polyedra.AAC.1
MEKSFPRRPVASSITQSSSRHFPVGAAVGVCGDGCARGVQGRYRPHPVLAYHPVVVAHARAG